jgi:hypothetical protein
LIAGFGPDDPVGQLTSYAHVKRLEVVIWHVAEHPPELGSVGVV